MKSMMVKALLLGFFVSTTASAGVPGDIPFFFTSEGGGVVNNNGIDVLPLFMNNPSIPEITSLELILLGLSMDSSADLDVYLIDPLGNALRIMTDRGGNVPLFGVNLTFSDDGIDLPVIPNQLVDGLDYRPEGAAGFAQYVGGSGGTDAWILLLIDDGGSSGGASLDSFVLSGTFVPEPATLALMGLGAIVLLRRKRR